MLHDKMLASQARTAPEPDGGDKVGPLILPILRFIAENHPCTRTAINDFVRFDLGVAATHQAISFAAMATRRIGLSVSTADALDVGPVKRLDGDIYTLRSPETFRLCDYTGSATGTAAIKRSALS